MQKLLVPLIIIAGGVLLNGCGLLDPVVAPEIKEFQIAANTPDAGACRPNSAAPILQVSPVNVFAPYDTKNMFYSESQYQINSYAYNQWSTNPGNMFTQAILQKLLASCIYSNVASAEVMATAKYRLVSQVMDFKQVVAGSTANMNLVILVQLIDNTTNLVVKSKTFSEASPVSASPDGYVRGANEVTNSFLNELAAWLGS